MADASKLATCVVKNLKGAPAIFVDGKPLRPMTFRTQWYYDLDYIQKHVRSGQSLCLYEVREPWHTDPAEYERVDDERIRSILALSPDLLIMIGLYVSVSPEWARTHKSEIVAFEDGAQNETPEGPNKRYPFWAAAAGVGHYSFASREYRRFGEERVRYWTRHFMEKDYARRIVGIFLQAGKAQEWNHFAHPEAGTRYYGDCPLPDYSPAMLAAFRKYLGAKHKTDAGLAKAWNEPGITLASAAIPTGEERRHVDTGYFRDPSISSKVMDYYDCQAKEIAARMSDFARVVKEETRSRWITGVFHEPTQDGGPLAYDWRAVADSDVLDFAAGPLAYEQRSPGDHSPLHHVIETLHANGKVFFSEDDLRPWPHPKAMEYVGRVKSLWESREVFKKEIGQNLTEAVQGWWFDFDFKWFEHPSWWRTFRRFNDLFELSMKVERGGDMDRLVVMDQKSYHYTHMNNRLYRNLVHREMIQEMGRLGGTAGQILHEDLDRPGAPDAKMLVFLNCFRLSDADRARIEKLKSGGRTLVFFYAQGLINDDRAPGLSEEHVADLTGIRMRRIDADVVAYATLMPGEHPIQRPFPAGLTFGQHARWANRDIVPPGVEISPVFTPDDKEAEVLGYYRWKHDPEPAIAVKDFGSWRSVYVGTVQTPAALLRAVARWAGCHMYLDTDDVVYTSRRWIVVHNATEAGEKTIRLRRASGVFDAWTGKRIARRAKEFTVSLKRFETGMYFLGDSMSPSL